METGGGLCGCAHSAVLAVPVSPAALLYCHQLWTVTATVISYRLEEIDGFFARNDEECLALIFEKPGSYLGREVSCPQGPRSSRGAQGVQGQNCSREFSAVGHVHFLAQHWPDPCWGTREVWELDFFVWKPLCLFFTSLTETAHISPPVS